jgi:lysophospholipase L1-like esterase
LQVQQFCGEAFSAQQVMLYISTLQLNELHPDKNMNPGKSRRTFIKNAATGVLSSLAVPEIVAAAMETADVKKITLGKNNVILFQGDSITDWHRAYDSQETNTINTLGYGYVLFTASQLLADYGAKNLRIYNKGVSGNKVFQLAHRWQTDCLALKPDVLSILIGVNDFWHPLTGQAKGTIETYIADYRALLKHTLQSLPHVKLIIGEPFAMPGAAVNNKWYPGFNAYQNAAHAIATEFGAVFLPYQSIFDKALTFAPPAYWTIDGVHPTVAGAGLMAQAWRQVIM